MITNIHCIGDIVVFLVLNYHLKLTSYNIYMGKVPDIQSQVIHMSSIFDL